MKKLIILSILTSPLLASAHYDGSGNTHNLQHILIGVGIVVIGVLFFGIRKYILK